MYNGTNISHYKILKKLGEVRLRQRIIAQGGPNYAKALMGGLVYRSFNDVI